MMSVDNFIDMDMDMDMDAFDVEPAAAAFQNAGDLELTLPLLAIFNVQPLDCRWIGASRW